MPFPPTFTDVWDHTTPPDTQLLNQGALDFRSLKTDIEQRLSLLSGTLANRPTPETVNAVWGGVGFGILYFATDNGHIYQWTGAGPAWVDVTLTFIPAATPAPASATMVMNTDVGTSLTTFQLVNSQTASITTHGGNVIVVASGPASATTVNGQVTIFADGVPGVTLAQITAGSVDIPWSMNFLFSPAAGVHNYGIGIKEGNPGGSINIHGSSVANAILTAFEVL